MLWASQYLSTLFFFFLTKYVKMCWNSYVFVSTIVGYNTHLCGDLSDLWTFHGIISFPKVASGVNYGNKLLSLLKSFSRLCSAKSAKTQTIPKQNFIWIEKKKRMLVKYLNPDHWTVSLRNINLLSVTFVPVVLVTEGLYQNEWRQVNWCIKKAGSRWLTSFDTLLPAHH